MEPPGPRHEQGSDDLDGKLLTEVSKPMLGRLEAPVVVDDAGYWLVRRPPGKKKLLEPQRLEQLPLKPIAVHGCLAGGM